MMMKKILSVLLVALMCAGAAMPAAAVEYQDEDRPRSIKLSESTLRLDIDESEYLSATVLPDTADETVTWSSSNSSVASVDDSGKVTANDAGNCVITAKTVNNLRATCRVIVREDSKSSSDSVYRVEVSPETMTVRVDATRQLIASVYPRDLDKEDRYVTWRTRDARIAEVDQDGNVRGISEGVTYITATSDNGKSGTCTVTVTSSSGSSSTSTATTTTSSASSSSSSSSKTTTTSGPLSAEAARSAVRTAVSNRVGYASFRGVTSISSLALSAAAEEAGSRSIQLRFGTAGADGKQYAYLSLDPKKVKSAVKVGVSLDSKAAVSVKNLFDKYYKNKTVVVACDQQGSFGGAVTIYVKANLSGMNLDRLVFYSYNSETGKVQELKGIQHTVDRNGWFTFSTGVGGGIVVSEGALTKK